MRWVLDFPENSQGGGVADFEDVDVRELGEGEARSDQEQIE